jgi:hypothetical protein
VKKLTEHTLQKNLRASLSTIGVISYASETVCTGFPDLIISSKHGAYFIELKLAHEGDSVAAWRALFEGIQLYHIARLPHAYSLIFSPAATGTLCRVVLAPNAPRYELEIVKENIKDATELMDTLYRIDRLLQDAEV